LPPLPPFLAFALFWYFSYAAAVGFVLVLAGYPIGALREQGCGGSDSALFRAASMAGFAGFFAGCCGCLGQLFFLWFCLLLEESFEGVGKEWLP